MLPVRIPEDSLGSQAANQAPLPWSQHALESHGQARGANDQHDETTLCIPACKLQYEARTYFGFLRYSRTVARCCTCFLYGYGYRGLATLSFLCYPLFDRGRDYYSVWLICGLFPFCFPFPYSYLPPSFPPSRFIPSISLLSSPLLSCPWSLVALVV